MTILTRTLNAIGLMTRAEHERAVSDRVSIAVHNDVVNAFKEQLANKEAKFKKATTDLAKQAEEIEANKQDADRVQHMLDESEKLVSALTDKNVDLIGKLQTARRERDAAMADAQKWRNSLKRSRDRKAAKKTSIPPARDKRAKNRGGGK